MDGIRQDLRAAVRLLLRAPGFAAVVVVTLALAIGATTSVFSVVRGLLLRPLPYRVPAKLVRFNSSWSRFPTGTISQEEYRQDYERLTKATVAGWGYGSGSLTGADSAEHIGFGRATSSLLPVLGVQPAIGRWFTRDEEEPGNSGVVVLGHKLWLRRFGADPGVVGQTVRISGHPFRVIGVLGDELELPESFDAWRPLPFPADRLGAQNRSARFLRDRPPCARGHAGGLALGARRRLRSLAVRLPRRLPGRRALQDGRGPTAGPDGRERAADVVDALRSGRPGAADGLRERGQPDARPRYCARA